MTTLRDLLKYLLDNYPHKSELSNARVTKLVYLTDWHHSLNNEHQVTEVKWVFDNYGPFVWDIKREAENNPDLFELIQDSNVFGEPKLVIRAKTGTAEQTLPESVKRSADHVIEVTKRLNWEQFIKLVYSTYPVLSSRRHSNLDLVAKAKELKAAKAVATAK